MKLGQNFWRRYFRVYDHLNELIPYKNLLNLFVSQSNVKTGNRVLDLGSGSGNLAIKFDRLGARVTGIDSSQEAMRLHRQKNPLANIVDGDITKGLPFEDDYFNVICSNNVIYTIDSQERLGLFEELYRVAKPGARIMISNLNKNFSPSKIYFDHIKISLKSSGVLKTIISIFKFIRPTILIFWYNFKIKKAHLGGQYQFLNSNEQETLLRGAGFHVSPPSLSVYSNQAFWIKGYK